MKHYFNDKQELVADYCFNDDYQMMTNDAVFNGVKEAVLKFWDAFEDKTPPVVNEIRRLKLLQNYARHAYGMVAKFTPPNQIKLLSHATGEAREWLEYFLFCNSIIPKVGGKYIIKDLNARILNIEEHLKDLQIVINKLK